MRFGPDTTFSLKEKLDQKKTFGKNFDKENKG